MLNKYLAKFVLVSFSVTLVLALRLASWPAMVPCPDALAGGGETYTVNTVVDEEDGSCSDGDCSLRDAIILANSISSGSHLINFDIQSGCGGYFTCTIYPTTPLPPLTGSGINIDGSGFLKWIQIDGSNAGSSDGFVITSANNVIKGLTIKKFQGYGVFISGSSATDNVISDNYIGTDASSTANQGNGLGGVYIGDGAQNNTIEDNVISGNGGDGIVIAWSAMNNTVSGNYIGTTANGTEALGNTGSGVYILNGAQNNTIGGDNSGVQNRISGNGRYGVRIEGNGTTGNTVSGNEIGTDGGFAPLPNGWGGVFVGNGAQSNTIGGNTSDEQNVISGNSGDGVMIDGIGTTGNVVLGNLIGTNISIFELGNTIHGVSIRSGAQNNTIGPDNVIVCNGWSGVYIDNSGTRNNTIRGNYIGTPAGGDFPLGNNMDGVYIRGGAHNNIVGPDNVIAHNGDTGVTVEVNTTGITITQNSIYSNAMGIELMAGANGGIVAPVIVTTTTGLVNIIGAACPNCTVEVFQNSDNDGEGEDYVEEATADASGNFTITVASLSKPYLTATATDAISGTSEFSAVFTATVPLAPAAGPAYLPIIMRNY